MLIHSVARPAGSFAQRRALRTPSVESVPKTVRWSFLLFICSFAFESVNIPYVTSGNLSVTKLLGLIFFGLYLFHLGIPQKKSNFAVPAAVCWFIVYLVIVGLTGLFVEDESIRGYISRLLTLLQLFVLLWCSVELLKDSEYAKKCLLAFSLGCAIVAVGSLAGVPGFAEVGASGRITAWEFNPNILAAIMGYAALSVVALCLSERAWSVRRKLIVFAWALPILALMVSTGSRSGVGAFLIGLFIFIFPNRRSNWIKAVFIALFVLGSLTYYISSDRLASTRITRTFEEGETAGRDKIYAAALEMVLEKPVFGWGSDVGPKELGARLALGRDRDAHNLILYLLLEVGLAGTVPFLVGLYLCVRAAWRGRSGPMGILPFALLMTSMAHSMVHTSLRMKIFWLVLAVSLAAGAAAKSTLMNIVLNPARLRNRRWHPHQRTAESRGSSHRRS